MRRLSLAGTGLHSGAPCCVTLSASPGPFAFVTERGPARREELRVCRADRGVKVEAARVGLRVDLVEHLFAALGGLSIHEGIQVEVRGPELPLLDGGAARFAEAVAALGIPPSPPRLIVARTADLAIGGAAYSFEVAPAVALEVEVDFAAPGIGRQCARWDGSAREFLGTIAWARTFGFLAEAERLRAAGRARAVDPRAVMVLDASGRVLPPGAPARRGEIAKHKLLDLVGDLYLYGGPPVGVVRASRPGHASTHEAVAVALDRGILKPSSGPVPPG